MKSLLDFIKSLRAQYTEDQSETLSEEIQLQIALSIVSALAIPATPDTNAWFAHREKVKKFLNDINEHFIINIGPIMKLVEAAWIMRYNLVHNPIKSVEINKVILEKLYREQGNNDIIVPLAFGFTGMASSITAVAGLLGQYGDEQVTIQPQSSAQDDGDHEYR